MLLYTRGLSRAVSHRLLAGAGLAYWHPHVNLTRQQDNHTITIRLETCPATEGSLKMPLQQITDRFFACGCVIATQGNFLLRQPDVDRHNSLEESSNASFTFTCDTYRMSWLPGEIDLHRCSKTWRREHLFGSNWTLQCAFSQWKLACLIDFIIFSFRSAVYFTSVVYMCVTYCLIVM